MEKAALDDIRSGLLAQRAQILDQQVETLETSKARDRETGLDSLDESSNESLESTMLRLRDRSSKLLSKIEKSLARIESGDYPFCEECGEDIGERRLRARPVTTYCIDCKEEQEREESRHAEPD